jgi:putative Holliday junction resolvase
MIILGVDWGRVRIGVAVSDETGFLARPLATVALPSRAASVAEVARLAVTARAQEIVVGLPLQMDGVEGESAQAARAFGEALAVATGFPVHFSDERCSTLQGQTLLREAGRRRGKGPGPDQAAACVILQGYLNSLRRPAS